MNDDSGAGSVDTGGGGSRSRPESSLMICVARSRQRGGRVEAEVVTQPGAQAFVSVEGVGAPPRPIQREHELTPELFSVRVLAHQPFELGDHQLVVAERQMCIDACGDGELTGRFQPGDFSGAVGPIGETVERRPSPEVDRFVEELEGEVRVETRRRPLGLLDEVHQAMCVHVDRSHAKEVAVSGGFDQPRGELLSNA